MSKTGKVLAVVVVVALMIAAIFGGTYNGFTTSYEKVQEKESAVEVAMQRRVDLIPNLVATVKSETVHPEAGKIRKKRDCKKQPLSFLPCHRSYSSSRMSLS